MKNFNWDMVTALGTVFAALATSAAVIVALYQAKWSNQKRMKLKFEDISIAENTDEKNPVQYICLTLTNTGNRKIIVTDWGYFIQLNSVSKNKMVLIESKARYHHIQTATLNLNESFKEFEIEIENQHRLYYPRDELLKSIRTFGRKKAKSLIKIGASITFFVTDSTGKRYRYLLKKSVEDYLDEDKDENK